MSTSDLLDEISWKSVLETESMELCFRWIICCEVAAFVDVCVYQLNKHNYRQKKWSWWGILHPLKHNQSHLHKVLADLLLCTCNDLLVSCNIAVWGSRNSPGIAALRVVNTCILKGGAAPAFSRAWSQTDLLLVIYSTQRWHLRELGFAWTVRAQLCLCFQIFIHFCSTMS